MRLSRSRPKLSEPKGAAQLGPAILLLPTICSGFFSGSQSAAIAAKTYTAIIARPTTVLVDMVDLAVTNARIEDAIEHVDERVGRHEQRGDDQHAGLNERIVALI